MTRAAKDGASREPQRRGRAVVQRVLDVTLEQLQKVGFERLSIPEVAMLAGVNKTSVYRHWPTKDALVRAALAAPTEQITNPPDTGDVRSDLIALARVVAEFTTSPRGMGVLRVLLAEGANPDMRALANSMYHRGETQVSRAVVKRAIRRGELPANASVKLVLFTIAGAIVHRVFVEQTPVTDAFLKRLVDLVLFGAVGRPPQARTSGQR